MNNKTSATDIAFLFVALVALIGLSACGMYHETYISPHKMQVQEKNFFQQASLSEISDARLADVAQDYDKHGKGPFELTVTYDPQSKTNTAMRASGNVSRIGSELRQNGVPEVNASIMPVYQSGGVSNVLMSYDFYEALPPKDCTTLDGIETTSVEADPGYKLGCSLNTVMAKQIVRPKDLAGSDNTDKDTDGRRSANIVEIHRSGVQNKPLEDSESASGD